MAKEVIRLRPQPGPQTAFASTPADIAIFGGAAFGGKTFACLLEPLRHKGNSEFGAVFFRRTHVELKKEGGAWDESFSIYSIFGAKPNLAELSWTFQSGAKVTFTHLQYEKTVHAFQGAQIPLLIFDQLEHFSEYQFFYMLSRNRSARAGIAPYVRANCNPDPDSWLAGFLEWWIDQVTGYPIPERSGVIRWMLRRDRTVYWYDTKEEALADRERIGLPDDAIPKSVTFIPAVAADNQIGMQADPGYMANMQAQDEVTKERLVYGNWKIRDTGSGMIKREWLRHYVEPPESFQRIVISGDTAEKQNITSAFSVFLVWGVTDVGYHLLFVSRERLIYGMLKERVIQLWSEWQPSAILIEDKSSGTQLIQELSIPDGSRPRLPIVAIETVGAGDKITRFNIETPAFQAGHVWLPDYAPWLAEYEREIINFPDTKFKDQADATSQFLKWMRLQEFAGFSFAAGGHRKIAGAGPDRQATSVGWGTVPGKGARFTRSG